MVSPYRTFLLVGFLDTLSVFFILPYLDIHAKELQLFSDRINWSYISSIFCAFRLISLHVSPTALASANTVRRQVCRGRPSERRKTGRDGYLLSTPSAPARGHRILSQGSLSDVKGRRPIFLSCLIICSFVYFWMGITSSLLVFICIRIVIGIFKHTQTLTKALAPDYIEDDNDVTALYGKLTSLGGLGIALGPVLSGYAMEAFPESGFTIMCTILSGVVILNAALINALPDIAKKKKEESEKALEATKLLDPIVKTFNQTINNFYDIDWTIYGDIFLYNFLMLMCMGLYYNNFRLFLNTELEASPSVAGYITTIQGIVSSITNEKVSTFNKWYINDIDYSLRIFHVFLVMVLSLIGLASVPAIPFYIAILIPTSVCFAFARIVTLVVVSNRSGTINRGTLLGAFDSASSVSGIITPILGGIINHYLGVTYVFYTSAMIASIGLVLSYRARAMSLHEKTK